jgi:hypothetical protein
MSRHTWKEIENAPITAQKRPRNHSHNCPSCKGLFPCTNGDCSYVNTDNPLCHQCYKKVTALEEIRQRGEMVVFRRRNDWLEGSRGKEYVLRLDW